MALRDQGHRLLPVVLDHVATETPQRVYASIPRSEDLADGFKDKTFADMAKAVHSCAWWIRNNVGVSNSFDTIAYVGVNDLRYAVIWFAAIKCGYKAS